MLGSALQSNFPELVNLMNASRTFSLPLNVLSARAFSNAGQIAAALGPLISDPDDSTTSAIVRAAVCFMVHFGDSRRSMEILLISLEYKRTAREPPTFSLQVFSNCSFTWSSKSCLE